MLIALTGPDGAGKSTLTTVLARSLALVGRPVRTINRWDIVDNPAYPTAGVLEKDNRHIRASVALMSNTSRLLFLLWSATMSLGDNWSPRPDDEVTLTDDYWMKHAASEIAYGLDQTWVEKVVAGLPQPNVVVYLRVRPEVAWQRKDGKPAPYECGMDMSCSKTSFLTHQGTIMNLLDQWALRFGWISIDAEGSRSTVLRRVSQQLFPTLQRT